MACVMDQLEAATWLPEGTWVSLNISPALASAEVPAISGRLVGIQVPHAGYEYSGIVAASAYEAVASQRYEGIIPAIESAHALAYAMRFAREKNRGSILVNLSGRGDKDIDYVFEHYGYGDRFFDQK
ncbi:MAG: AmmeMemoRadiSam system protein B [Alphaproteobacteria bacterium]|nr:AmmeMemoRadiSam system protein B [Alphaproteobacteria bacterium]